jgi:hypothetical protein
VTVTVQRGTSIVSSTGTIDSTNGLVHDVQHFNGFPPGDDPYRVTVSATNSYDGKTVSASASWG